MTKFNIFNIGNGLSSGHCVRSEHNSTREDPLWKKTINHHPDNLYNTWVDYIAMRLDARMFYISRPELDIKKSVNLLENTINVVKKDFPNHINLYFLNTSLPITTIPINFKSEDKFVTEEFHRTWSSNETVDLDNIACSMLCYFNEYRSINKLIDIINNKTDYNNRIIVFNIDNLMFSKIWKICRTLEYVLNPVKKIEFHLKDEDDSVGLDNIINKLSKSDWVYVLKHDLSKVVKEIDQDNYNEFTSTKGTITHMPEKFHDFLGQKAYEDLTNSSKLLTI